MAITNAKHQIIPSTRPLLMIDSYSDLKIFTEASSKSKNRAGRPSSMTNEVVAKLMALFIQGFSVREACQLIGISIDSYYRRQRVDEDFAKNMLTAQNFILNKAREIVIRELFNGNLSAAKWWLERKAPAEFNLSIIKSSACFCGCDHCQMKSNKPK
jgi:hypothetical protein